ncbi:MAG: putative anti-sigma regulatory factor, serine/threonine protein kinase [Ilumatobacteraceae bacterium]|nr:putative anti-sigma regulatory factor, serine/threonine protein kinase [Ilumatobacteraceae bacterium]
MRPEPLTLPADHSSVRVARQHAVALAPEALDPQVVALLTSELVTNVVRHADTEIRVQVVPGPPFRVEVHDGAAATVAFRKLIDGPPSEVDPRSEGGRGIALVHRLAARIGLDDDPDGGKVVWFEL